MSHVHPKDPGDADLVAHDGPLSSSRESVSTPLTHLSPNYPSLQQSSPPEDFYSQEQPQQSWVQLQSQDWLFQTSPWNSNPLDMQMQDMMIPPQWQLNSQEPQQAYTGQYHGNTQFLDFDQVGFQPQSQPCNVSQHSPPFPTAISPEANSIQRHMQAMPQSFPASSNYGDQFYRPFPQENIRYPTSFDGVSYNGADTMGSLGYNTQMSRTGSESHRSMDGSGYSASQLSNDSGRTVSNINPRQQSGFGSGNEVSSLPRLSASSQNTSFDKAPLSPRQRHARALARMTYTFPIVPQAMRDEYLAAKKLRNPAQPETPANRLARSQAYDQGGFSSQNANDRSKVQTEINASSLPNTKTADFPQPQTQEQQTLTVGKRSLRYDSSSSEVSTQETKRARTVNGSHHVETKAPDPIDPELPTAPRPETPGFSDPVDEFIPPLLASPTSEVNFDTNDTHPANSSPEILTPRQSSIFTSLALANRSWMATMADLGKQYNTE